MQSNEEVRSQVCEVLERFNSLVSTRNQQVLAEFARGDEVLLVGSDTGEVAMGKQELEAFFLFNEQYWAQNRRGTGRECGWAARF